MTIGEARTYIAILLVRLAARIAGTEHRASMAIGHVDDDFCRGLKTVRLQVFFKVSEKALPKQYRY